MKLISEGTKSYLFGCHHFLIHPLVIIKTWKKIYGKYPYWWEIIGIIFHDIGICGRNYISNDEKFGHWILGSNISFHIVHFISKFLKDSNNYKSLTNEKEEGGYIIPKKIAYPILVYVLIAGHSPNESKYPKSKLFYADKQSWIVAPSIWLWWNYFVEFYPDTKVIPPKWKKIVKENMEKNFPIKSSHELYNKMKG